MADEPPCRGIGRQTYELREYRPGDEHEILRAFQCVFAAEPEARRSLAEWRWKFLENPDGWRIWLALRGSEVVAQSAGLAHRALVAGAPETLSQTVDSMVLPEHRAGLKNPGLFVRTVQEYVRSYGGVRDLVFYGWPNRVAARIGRAQISNECVREERFLARELGSRIVLTLFPPWSRWSARFQAGRYSAWSGNFTLVVRIHRPDLTLADLRERWWVQLGDSDLV